MILTRLKDPDPDGDHDLIVYEVHQDIFAVIHADDQCAGHHHFFYSEDYEDGALGARRAAQEYMLTVNLGPCSERGETSPCDSQCRRLHGPLNPTNKFWSDATDL